jgi:hypothetical protein
MRKLIPLVLLLSACATTPVPIERKFPPYPKALSEKCEPLKPIEPTDKVPITDMLKTVVENYVRYYNCATKVEGWQEWYTEQKKIFEDVNQK